MTTTDGLTRTALYRLYDDSGTLLYVGITNDIDIRWKTHGRHKPWWGVVAAVGVQPLLGAAVVEDHNTGRHARQPRTDEGDLLVDRPDSAALVGRVEVQAEGVAEAAGDLAGLPVARVQAEVNERGDGLAGHGGLLDRVGWQPGTAPGGRVGQTLMP